MFPIIGFSGDRMTNREIRIIDMPANFQLAFITIRNVLCRKKHYDECFRFRTDHCPVNGRNVFVFRMVRISFVLFMSPSFQFFRQII